ncbi:MAG: hypothetical protein NTV06_09250 [candidate division Zixibacteria bacterium]|nr:hypothetical protein [candidate division Zixibacteria bacterium]
MELIAFYLYQSMAGSLYSEMGVLIGAFMLGLAIGTYFSLRSDRERLEIPAFLLMLTALILFMVTYERIATGALIFYYILFLFTIAIATASLFVAATNRYYFGRAEINRGIGYAFEIIGSSLGALIPCTILLPLIGLPWILGAIMALIIVALAGAMISAG